MVQEGRGGRGGGEQNEGRERGRAQGDGRGRGNPAQQQPGAGNNRGRPAEPANEPRPPKKVRIIGPKNDKPDPCECTSGTADDTQEPPLPPPIYTGDAVRRQRTPSARRPAAERVPAEQRAERVMTRKEQEAALRQALDADHTVRNARNLTREAQELREVHDRDPSSAKINYGHRTWPIDMTSEDDYTTELMYHIWPKSWNWQDDPTHRERCFRLIDEFQRTGLPQTIHTDTTHETENPQPWVVSPAFKCSCWKSCLGDGWFNFSDATLVKHLGPDWGIENSHLFLPLLRRLVIAMTVQYMKCSKEYCDNNPLRRVREMRRRNWWPDECTMFLEKLLEIRGIQRAQGRYWDLEEQEKVLVTEQTGLLLTDVQRKLHDMRRARDWAAGSNQEFDSEEGDGEGEKTASLAVLIMETKGSNIRKAEPRKIKHFKNFSHAEERFWIEYVLNQRMLNPSFTRVDIPSEKYQEFQKECGWNLQDSSMKLRIKSYLNHLLSLSPKAQSKGPKLQAEAVAAYNFLARAARSPDYDPAKLSKNNMEWCKLAVATTVELFTNRRNRIKAGQIPPSDLEARDEAALNDSIRMNLAIERSLKEQHASDLTMRTESEADRQKKEDAMMEEAIRQSAQEYSRRLGKPQQLIRDPQERERRAQALAAETDRGKGRAASSPSADSSDSSSLHVDHEHDRRGETSRPHVTPSPESQRDPSPDRDLSRPDLDSSSSRWEGARPEPSAEGKEIQSSWEGMVDRLTVGSLSVSSRFEPLLRERLYDEGVIESEAVKTFIRLASPAKSSPPEPPPLPSQGQPEESDDLINSILQDHEDERRQRLSPPQGPGGGDGDDGGGPGGGGGGGGEPGGRRGEPEISGVEFLQMYNYVAEYYPDVLPFIRWPPRFIEFQAWVMERWPDMYYNVRWPRPVPAAPPAGIWDDPDLADAPPPEQGEGNNEEFDVDDVLNFPE